MVYISSDFFFFGLVIGHGGTVDKALDLDLHAFMESKALGFLFYSELMGRERERDANVNGTVRSFQWRILFVSCY